MRTKNYVHEDEDYADGNEFNNQPEKKEDKPATRMTTIPHVPLDMGVGESKSGECMRYQEVLATEANDGGRLHLLLKVDNMGDGVHDEHMHLQQEDVLTVVRVPCVHLLLEVHGVGQRDKVVYLQQEVHGVFFNGCKRVKGRTRETKRMFCSCPPN
jgi:hypothetical protein